MFRLLSLVCITAIGAPAVTLGVPSDLAQQGILALPSPVANDQLGRSIALSSNGSTIAAGAPGFDFTVSNRGGVGLFSRSGSSWAFDQTVVSNGTPLAGDDMGRCVAVSGNGLVMATGIPNDDIGANADQGSVYVADVLSGVSGVGAAALWAGATLLTDTAPNAVANAQFGCPIALSYDGATLAVGAPGSASNQGHVSVFTRSGFTYTRQAVLTRPGGAANEEFPSDVALAANGSTLLTGTGRVGSFSGSATAFVRTGVNWAAQWTLNGGASENLGQAVALSSNGGVGLVFRSAQAVIVDHSGSSWTARPAAISTPVPEGNFVFQGFIEDLAISGDGRVAAVATPNSRPSSPIQVGRVHTYDISGATPVALQHLTPTEYAANDRWGDGGVALSDDGSTLAVGTPSADAGAVLGTGKVAVFASPTASPAPGGSGSSGGSSSGGSAAGGGGSPGGSASTAAPARPAVKWTYTRSTRRLVGTITPVTGVTYAMTATKGKTVKRGACKPGVASSGSGKKRKKKRIVTCSIKVGTGAWAVAITPSAGGRAGTPARKTVR